MDNLLILFGMFGAGFLLGIFVSYCIYMHFYPDGEYVSIYDNKYGEAKRKD